MSFLLSQRSFKFSCFCPFTLNYIPGYKHPWLFLFTFSFSPLCKLFFSQPVPFHTTTVTFNATSLLPPPDFPTPPLISPHLLSLFFTPSVSVHVALPSFLYLYRYLPLSFLPFLVCPFWWTVKEYHTLHYSVYIPLSFRLSTPPPPTSPSNPSSVSFSPVIMIDNYSLSRSLVLV